MSKVNINVDRTSIKLRWSYLGKRYSLHIGKVSEIATKAAKAKAKLIESDLLFDRFDVTLAKYSDKYRTNVEQVNLQTAWCNYKELSSKRVALTTQKECWSQVDRCLSKLPKPLLALQDSELAVNYLLKHYSVGTLKRVIIDLNSAVNLAIGRRYYALNKLPKRTTSQIECFSTAEVNTIINAFEHNTYQSAYSQYTHDYYADYVRFLVYTAARPEEAIALTWSDVDLHNKVLTFNKAYSKRILKPTKTNVVRSFPINDQLAAILDKPKDFSTLVFPSVCGGYINHGTWSSRYWSRVVSGLASDRMISKYLKCYCLRHSGITRLIRAGYDVATVAVLVGTSPEMIFNNYLAPINTHELRLPSV